MNKEEKIIHSQRVCGYLMLKGFYLKQIRDSFKNKGRNVYVFNASEELNHALDKYEEFFNKNKDDIIRKINK